MGRKVKTESDPKLAKPHKEGAIIEWVQPALNDLGLIYIGQPIYWSLHARYADLAYKRLKKYENLILSQSPNKTNVRSVHDIKLISKIYKATCDMVIHLYLLFENFTLFTLTAVYLYLDTTEENKNKFNFLKDQELKEKIRHILVDILDKPKLVNSKGYSMLFQEWEQIRHAINHPKNENIYNCGDNTWDSVPMAWAISGKGRKFFDEIAKLFNEMHNSWNFVEKKYSHPATLPDVKRGIKSRHASFVKKLI